MKTVEQMIMEKLKELGAEGLCNQVFECGCHITDLCSCGDISTFCEAAKVDRARSRAFGAESNMLFCMIPMETPDET